MLRTSKGRFKDSSEYLLGVDMESHRGSNLEIVNQGEGVLPCLVSPNYEQDEFGSRSDIFLQLKFDKLMIISLTQFK